jgi:hypothetical protein
MTAAFEPPAILDVVDRWHRFMRGQLAEGLDGPLDDDVILYSSGSE